METVIVWMVFVFTSAINPDGSHTPETTQGAQLGKYDTVSMCEQKAEPQNVFAQTMMESMMKTRDKSDPIIIVKYVCKPVRVSVINMTGK